MKRITLFNALFDVLMVTAAFLCCVWLKPGTGRSYVYMNAGALIIFLALWVVMSLVTRKYRFALNFNLKQSLVRLVLVNLSAASLLALIMYFTRRYEYSRFVVFGTVTIATIIEMILIAMHRHVHKLPTIRETSRTYKLYQRIVGEDELHELRFRELPELVPNGLPEEMHEAIVEEASEEAYHYITRRMSLLAPDHALLSTTTRINILQLPRKQYRGLVNLKKINNIRFVNKFFETVNSRLETGALFMGCVETKNQRRHRIMKKFPLVINYIFYFFDYIIKRIFPKFSLTKRIYFFLTRGQNRVITRAETLGRLYSCGFEVVEEMEIDNHFWFLCRKIKEPNFDTSPTYGPMVKLERVGKGGKIIKVYKMRTMHPFAEYLQDYIYQRNKLQEGGKFKDDFRIHTAGKIMRKFWLDELPMLINLFRGDLKLVGVRPLSRHYFSLYDKDLQELRIKTKPGLVPPFYADMPKTLEEIQASERKYLEAYLKHPLRTDWVYFWKAFTNILFRKARSQ